MAMDLREYFTIKSRQQREAEQRVYNRWAFPYGPQQMAIVEARILEMMPDEKKTGMAIYLMGREAYGNSEKAEEAARLETVSRALREYLPGKHRKKLYKFLALILADAQVDERLQYPDADTLCREAERLEEML